MPRRSYSFIFILAIVLILVGIGWVIYLNRAHSSFVNYYSFRGCTRLLVKTNNYGWCQTQAGAIIKIVKYQNKWFLDGDLPASAKGAILPVDYTNFSYGFDFSLPDSWLGYKVIDGTWQGYSVGEKGDAAAANGPTISLRHPAWTEKNPRQDIPIMIFTIKQWDDLQQDKFHIGAAPIGPSELGRNDNYVFALPARYNYAFPIGFLEVDSIIQSKPLHAF